MQRGLAAMLLKMPVLRRVPSRLAEVVRREDPLINSTFKQENHMRPLTLLSALLCGLSTFLSAQPQLPPSVRLDVGVGGQTEIKDTNSSTSEGSSQGKKLDVDEVIKTGTVFTNGVGMVLKKVGDLWVCTEETTQEAYQKVTGSNPSAFAGARRPVDSVSWENAISFCEKLTVEEKSSEMLPDGYRYGLPTQAQWESLAGGVALTDAVTSSSSQRSSSAEVGSLAPSTGGIYDLRGNLAEWCADPAVGSFRVLRGGSWADRIEINLRNEFRIYAAPGETRNTYGFRCVLIPGK